MTCNFRGGKAQYFTSFLCKDVQLAKKTPGHGRKVCAGRRTRALREGPLTGKLEASPEGPLNLLLTQLA
eukprot:1139217-Pelagomonas_calceolata.AAC.7